MIFIRELHVQICIIVWPILVLCTLEICIFWYVTDK